MQSNSQMLILKIQREMELQKKEQGANRKKKPPIARTEPKNSDTSSIILGSINNDKVPSVAASELNADRYKAKPSFPRAQRFFKIDAGSLTRSVTKGSESLSPRSQISIPVSVTSSNTVLEKFSLSQMKAKFAKELKLMIDNEIKQQKVEQETTNKFESKIRR